MVWEFATFVVLSFGFGLGHYGGGDHFGRFGYFSRFDCFGNVYNLC
jgi:hypothetical protein